MLSDTAVQSPSRISPRNFRANDISLGRDFRTPPVPANAKNGILKTVQEDQEADKSSAMHDVGDAQSPTSPAMKSAQVLRDQADELRRRISFLQKRSKKGITASPEEFQKQVEALKKTLESQEAVIARMENAATTPLEPTREDARGEWQQVFDTNKAREESEELSENEYFEDEEELLEDLPDVLGDEEVDEIIDTGAAHEDRSDAFDYETFVLHSAMGRGLTRSSSFTDSERSSRSLSSGSEASIETEKGEAPVDSEPQSASGSEERRHTWEGLGQSNESMASLTTTQSFETANENMSSDVDSDSSEQHHDEDLLRTGLQDAWPMPPQQHNGAGPRRAARESDVPTPKAEGFPAEALAVRSRAARPLSSIFETLLVPEDGSESPRSLDKADLNLIKRCADSLRSVCLEAIHPNTSARDMKALRERLEVAKRVLNGEL
ncbi:MAG: hypothetical protein Q9162_004734 [Coniocarpon cinnabarinum]